MQQFETTPDELNKVKPLQPVPKGSPRAHHRPGSTDVDADADAPRDPNAVVPTAATPDTAAAPTEASGQATDADGSTDTPDDSPLSADADGTIVVAQAGDGTGAGAGAGAAGVDAGGAGGGSGAAGAGGAGAADAAGSAGGAVGAAGADVAAAGGAGALLTPAVGLSVLGGAGLIAAVAGGDHHSGSSTPTQTISGIHISADTGSSSTDFNTATAEQTVTATLGTALGTSDHLFASVDGGVTFVDITADVTGKNVSWSTSLEDGAHSIQFQVRNATSTVATAQQAYVLDTTAPVAGELSVPEAPAGVNEVETASDGGVPVIVPFAEGVVAGATITLALTEPGSNTPITITHVVTAADVTAGSASVLIPTADVGTTGVYGVTATITDLAGNTSAATEPTEFTVLPPLVEGEDCTIFGFAERQYAAATPAVGAPDGTDVFLVTHGMVAPVDELTTYNAAYGLYTGTDLASAVETGVVGAGGVVVSETGSEAGHDYVVGAAAFAAASTAGAFVTQQSNTIITNTLSLTIDSTDTAKGSVYELADASGGSLAQAGTHELLEDVTAAGTATAGGAIVASAQSTAESAQAVANVEICNVSITAHGAAGEGDTGAVASLGADLGQLGVAAIGTADMVEGIAAIAHSNAIATVTIEEGVQIAAFSSGSGTASAYIAGIDALVLNGSNHATAHMRITGDIAIRAESDSGVARAFLGGEGAGMTALASGKDSVAFDEIYGNVSVSATGDSEALAVAGGIVATASDDAQLAVGVIYGNLDVEAKGTEGATAVMGEIAANADSVHSSAGAAVAGQLTVHASAASATAFATVTGLRASTLAASGSSATTSDNRISQALTGGSITISAEGGGDAHAEFNHASAVTGGNDGDARAAIGFAFGPDVGDGLDVTATAQDSATAHVGRLQAEIDSGDNSHAEVDVAGNVSVAASGHSAHANVSTIDASLSGASHASGNVHIGGDVSIHAIGDGGSADASLNVVYAYANGLSAQAVVTIDGGIDVNASGTGATAHVHNISASAATSSTGSSDLAPRQHSVAIIDIGGPIAVMAAGGSGDAEASLDLVKAIAKSADDTVAVNAGSITIDAEAAGSAQAKLSSIAVTASADAAQATVDIEGDLVLHAHSTGIGSATADFASFNFSADAPGAHAFFEINGNLAVSATAASGNANAYAYGLYAHAIGLGTVGNIEVTGGVDIQATGSGKASAYLTYLGATGYSAAAANLTIGNAVTVSANSLSGDAVAYLSEAYAFGSASGAVGDVTIGGALEIGAGGESGASAKANKFYAEGKNGGSGNLKFAGDVGLHAAAASGNATASLVSAYAYGIGAAGNADALLSIGGSIEVTAQSAGNATAMLGAVDAEAYSGLHNSANTRIGGDGTGDLVISATAGDGNAHASMHTLSAYASESGHAQLSIGHDVSITAQAQDNAVATLEHLKAVANDSGQSATAVVNINGDLTISATSGTPSGSANASLGDLEVEATLANSLASITIGGDLTVHAESKFATALTTEASIGDITVDASGNHASSALKIGGSLIVEALADGSQTYNVEASIDEIQIEANATGAVASMTIGGDLKVVANAYDNGSISEGAPFGVRAQASVSSISVEANGANSKASLTIGGNIEVQAYGNGGNVAVTASLSSISASADGVSSLATINIEGGVNVWADAGTGTNAFAEASFSSVSAEAGAAGAIASVTIAKDVVVGARAAGDNARAEAYMSSFSADGYNGGVATVTLGGNVDVSAVALGVGAIASASFDGASADASNAGRATVILERDISVGATALDVSGVAKAGMDGLTSETRNGDANSELDIRGDIAVRAFGAGTATAHLDQFLVETQGIDGVESAAIFLGGEGGGGNVDLSANGDMALATFATHGLQLVAFGSSSQSSSDAPAILVHAGNGGTATLSIGGHIDVSAGGVAAATALMGGILETTDPGGNATISIDGGIDVGAIASGGEGLGVAHASVGQFSHYQTGQDGVALRNSGGIVIEARNGVGSMTIGGDVGVHATASAGASALLYGVSANASSSGTATMVIGGDITVQAAGGVGNASASMYHVHAFAGLSDPASLTINGDIKVTANGDDAHAFGGIYDATGTGATVSVAGSITVGAHGIDVADAQAAFFADDGGTLNVHDVHMTVSSQDGVTPSSADNLLLEVGAYDNAHVNVGAIDVTLNGAGTEGKIFIGADSDVSGLPTGYNFGDGQSGDGGGSQHFAGSSAESEDVAVGPLDVTTGAGADMTVWTDHVAWSTNNVATFHGAGDVTFLAADPAYAVIDLTGSTGSFYYSEMTATPASEADNTGQTADSFDFTVIKGFDVTKDQIGFGNVTASVGTWRDIVDVNGTTHDKEGINYGISSSHYSVIGSSQTANAGTANSEAALFTALNLALDSSHDVAYAKFDGSLMAGNVAITDDATHDWYAVAYDGNGTGITSLIFVEVAEGAAFGNVDISTVPGSPT